jgi:DMSO/TMAO reductase YedYZ molybdopterin-dependent catalytic subunit
MGGRKISRRELGSAVAGLGALAGARGSNAEPLPRELAAAVAGIEPYFFPQGRFLDVSRGNPVPHRLPEERRREVGLTRETWSLEVIADPEAPTRLERPLSRAAGAPLDFAALMGLAEKHAVRFPKVMTCLNIGCPLGMGIWEGVPLREVLWLTQPRENLRRVIYHGYHNDDPAQMFRASLPVARVLEDPFDLPPVILCYKLNGQWLTPERGGPVRIAIPEAYGFKNVKWLTHVMLSNLSHANDTYALQNNDIDSPLKTFAAALPFPATVAAGAPIPITGWAQAGLAGLSKVQWWVQPAGERLHTADPHFLQAPWRDAHLLPPPRDWGGDLPEGRIPAGTLGFDGDRPRTWPMRLCKAHWAALLPALPAGDYVFRSRTIDEKGRPQPLPRPFRKGGWADIQAVPFSVRG